MKIPNKGFGSSAQTQTGSVRLCPPSPSLWTDKEASERADGAATGAERRLINAGGP